MKHLSKLLILSAVIPVSSGIIRHDLKFQTALTETVSESGASSDQMEIPPHQRADVMNELWAKFGKDPEPTLAEVEGLVRQFPRDYRYKVMNITFLERLYRFEERDYLSYIWRHEPGVISGSVYPLASYCIRHSLELEGKWLEGLRINLANSLLEYYEVSKDLKEAPLAELGPLMNAILVHQGETSGKKSWMRKYSDKILAENPTSFVSYGILAKRAFHAKPIELEIGRRNYREFMKARAANPDWEKWFARIERSYSRHMEDRPFERSGIIFPNPPTGNPVVSQN